MHHRPASGRPHGQCHYPVRGREPYTSGMATRKGVAASIAATILFSSLIVSNFVIFSGSEEDFRLVSLATEERAFHVQSVLITETSALDMLDGAQRLLSSGHFTCSNATDSVAHVISSEVVHLSWGGLRADSTMTLSSGDPARDNLTGLHPFNGSVGGMTDLSAFIAVQGNAPDGSVRYFRSEQHLLNIPLRLGALTERCLDAESEVSAALASLGGQACNSSSLAGVETLVASEVESAAAAGFSLSIDYFVTSAQPCRVGYRISAEQANVAGPEGAFTFAEDEYGAVGA